MITKIVMFHGGVETQEYFLMQMKTQFEKLGYEVYVYDLLDSAKSYNELVWFAKENETAVITCNFTGIAGEEDLYDNGVCFWNQRHIPCLNIVVDHPFYYHHFLKKDVRPENYYHLSIDRNHLRYMQKYFKEVTNNYFLPLAGSRLNNNIKPKSIRNRGINVVFTGNYEAPQHFYQYVESQGEDYINFYNNILDDLKSNPNQLLEDVAKRHIESELGDVADEDLKPIFANMIFLDMMIRFYYRGEVIKSIVDSGIPIHICGAGWEKLDCKHPENMHVEGFTDSRRCLEVLADSKISINVMPWFKDGAHDRIFNSMLNGAVCISDSSIYLDELLGNGINSCVYSLEDVDKNCVSDIVRALLADEDRMQQIADSGYEMASNGQEWADRADKIHDILKNI